MRLTLALIIILLTTARAFSQGIDMGSLLPVLTFPEPAPTDDTVSRDKTTTSK